MLFATHKLIFGRKLENYSNNSDIKESPCLFICLVSATPTKRMN